MKNLIEQTFHQIRQDAISWWNNLPFLLQDEWKNKFYPTRNVVSLTGREIQLMYEEFKRDEFFNGETL